MTVISNFFTKFLGLWFILLITAIVFIFLAKKKPRYVKDENGGHLAPSRFPIYCFFFLVSLLIMGGIFALPGIVTHWDEFRATELASNPDYYKYEYYTVTSKCVDKDTKVSGGGGFIFHNAVKTTNTYIFENGYSTTNEKTSDGETFYVGKEYNLIYVKVFTRTSIDDDFKKVDDRLDRIEST